MRAAQGLACREPSAKSQTASRSCLLTAQRKVTALCLPDWRVDGAAPARQISAWAQGSGPGSRRSRRAGFGTTSTVLRFQHYDLDDSDEGDAQPGVRLTDRGGGIGGEQ